MSTWDFTTGAQPLPEADNVASKRNVVATEKGWVRQQAYTDTHGNVRVKEEVIVAAHPGPSQVGGYTNAANLGEPDITLIQLGANTITGSSTFKTTVEMEVFVTWNEPFAATADVVLTAKDIVSGANTIVFTSTGPESPDYVANNTLLFKGTPTVTAVGQYKFETADLLTSVAPPTSTNSDGEPVSLTIAGPVSNSVISVIGDSLANGEFTIVD
tara:strand:+ start:3543 stop:4184 length:642 start_codon:yes stop_codon:yes gene_type:complete